MPDCPDNNEDSKPSGRPKWENVLFYACSGAANVAEIADRVARELTRAGDGSMFCLAGIAAGIEEMIETAREADLNVVIDGCEMDCAKKVFDRAGLTNYTQFRVTDLGIRKIKGAKPTDQQIAVTIGRARRELN